MRLELVLFFVLFTVCPSAVAQSCDGLTIFGYVSDKKTEAKISGANVSVVGETACASTRTDGSGYFKLQLVRQAEKGSTIRVEVDKVGYRPYDEHQIVSTEVPIDIRLVSSASVHIKKSTVAVNQLDLAERPWVKMSISPSGPLRFDQYGLTAQIRIVTQNSGNSPAVSVVIKAKMLLDLGWQESRIAEERTKLCGELKKLASENREEFETIFPGTEETPKFWNLTVPKTDVDKTIQTGVERGIPLVVSCVVYRSTFNNTFHETAYTSTIMTVENGMGMGVPLKQNSTINPERLALASQTHAN